MIKLKKNSRFSLPLFLLLFLITLNSCNSKKYLITRIEGKKNPITQEYNSTEEIEHFIVPYRTHINKDLDSVLAYSPETMDKSKGKGQTTIGNLMAEVTFQYADKVFFERQRKNVDICLLNHGGIRSIIAEGNITARTAYEIMPFENQILVLALKGEQIKEIADYMMRDKKPHPLAGMEITTDKQNIIKQVLVKGEPVNNNKVYYVATSDYLASGGDKMDFFKKAVATYDLDYKIRNVLIDYFKAVDTLPVITTKRIIIE